MMEMKKKDTGAVYAAEELWLEKTIFQPLREALFEVRSIKILIGPATTAMSSNLSRPVIGTASLSENRRDSRAHRFDLVLFLLRAI